MRTNQRILTIFWGTAVVLIAAVLRIPALELLMLWPDEFAITLAAIDIAQNGSRPLVGATSAFSGLSHHSPFTTYLLAGALRALPDPLTTRAFVALIGVLTVALWYTTVRRYFGLTTAVLAGLALAVLPNAVHWSRFVWNPNIGQFAVPLWFLTGLLGYYEDKRWAQLAHWLALSANIQSQAALIYLLPISVLLAAVHLWRQRAAWQRHVLATTIGICLFVLSLLPWGVGLRQVGAPQPITVDTSAATALTASIDLSQFDVRLPVNIIGSLFGATTYPVSQLGWHPNPVGIWTVLPMGAVGWLQAMIALLGLLLLLLDSSQHRELPGVFLPLIALLPFGVAFVASGDTTIADYYFLPVMFVGTLGFSYAVSWVWQSRPRLRVIVAVVVALVFLRHVTLVAAHGGFLAQQGHLHPVGNMHLLGKQAEAWLQHGESIVLVRERHHENNLPDAQKFTVAEQYASWRVMSLRYPIMITDVQQGTNAIAVQPGQAYVGMAHGTFLETWFTGVAAPMPMGDSAPRYRVAAVDAGTGVTATAVGGVQYADVARMMGANIPEAVCPGREGTITLVWEPLVHSPEVDYHFSVRLVSGIGRQRAQVDVQALPSRLWQPGATALTRVALPITTQIAADNLALQVVMYTLPDAAPLSVPESAEGYFVSIPLLDCADE